MNNEKKNPKKMITIFINKSFSIENTTEIGRVSILMRFFGKRLKVLAHSMLSQTTCSSLWANELKTRNNLIYSIR